MAVPRRSHWLAVALRKFWTCSKFPPCHHEGPRFWQFSAVLRRSMKEPQRKHGDHGGATAFYAVQTPQWHRASGVTGVEGSRFWQLSAVLRGSMTEPLCRLSNGNHGDHGDATAVTAGVTGQESSRARSSRLLSARLRYSPGVVPCQ